MRKIGNSDFSTKPTNYYNFDVIISIGYRVNSSLANDQVADFKQIWEEYGKDMVHKIF